MAALRAEKLSVDSLLRDNQEQLVAILQTARDAFVIIDLQGRYVDANPAACQMTGYSRVELLGMTIFDLEVDESPAEIVAQLEQIKQAGAALFERRHRCKDGRIIHVEVSANYLPNSTGRLFAFVRDITARKQAEAVRHLQSAALEAAANAIVITDRAGKIEWVNAAFTTFTGYSAAEAIGQNPRVLKSGKHEPAFYKDLWETILTGKVWHKEIINRRKDGSFYTDDMMITPLKDEDGVIIHFIAVKQDVTQQKMLEVEFRQSQKMEAVGMLAGGVAHDFNNLLCVIIGNVAHMQMGVSAEEQQFALEEISKASERAANLTRQLLAFGRRQVMQMKLLDLNSVIADIIKMLQRIIGEDITLETFMPPGGSLVQADSGMINQVLLNLAVNARDAMPHGGKLGIRLESVAINETVAASHHQVHPCDFIRLSVRDTGRGIAPEVLPHIFEPFFTTKDVGKGSGLGLATVHGIVEQHHGWVEVESEAGKGTVFHVFLPKSAVAPQLETGEEPARRVRGGKETILLVEDELALRTLIANGLEHYGYQVIKAESGMAGLKMWRKHRDEVDLLLTDIIMPEGVSGSELALQLQADKPALKVIYMSGYPGEVVGCGLDLCEGVSFLQKPFTPVKLAQIVRDRLDAVL